MGKILLMGFLSKLVVNMTHCLLSVRVGLGLDPFTKSRRKMTLLLATLSARPRLESLLALMPCGCLVLARGDLLGFALIGSKGIRVGAVSGNIGICSIEFGKLSKRLLNMP